MADEQKSRYDETRRNFDELNVEEQASFLVEATASTLARGVLQVGETLADGLEDVLRRARKQSSPGASGTRPGPAEPETSQRRAPRSGSQSSGSGS
jgi:hypothetical protein